MGDCSQVVCGEDVRVVCGEDVMVVLKGTQQTWSDEKCRCDLLGSGKTASGDLSICWKKYIIIILLSVMKLKLTLFHLLTEVVVT